MKRILIIEDDPDLTDLYQTKFMMEQFEVLTASDGGIGIEKASSEKPDVILLDILMPNVNGFEVLKQLKTQSETKDVPVIVYTNLGSSDSDEKRELAFSLGAADYLVKALHEPESIVERVNRLFNRPAAGAANDTDTTDTETASNEIMADTKTPATDDAADVA